MDYSCADLGKARWKVARNMTKMDGHPELPWMICAFSLSNFDSLCMFMQSTRNVWIVVMHWQLVRELEACQCWPTSNRAACHFWTYSQAMSCAHRTSFVITSCPALCLSQPGVQARVKASQCDGAWVVQGLAKAPDARAFSPPCARESLEDFGEDRRMKGNFQWNHF